MQHQMIARYPAPSDVVIKMFTDKDYHSRKMDKLGITYEILAHEFENGQFRLKAERQVPTNATGIAAKFMPKTSEVVNDEKWSLADKTGSVVVETRGVPLDMHCTAHMADDGDGCVVTYDWTVKARIPVGGGKLEKFVVSDMENRAEEERKVAVSLLGDYQ